MQEKSLIRGFIYALFCFQLYALADVFVKLLSTGYHFSEIIFFINLVIAISVITPLFFAKNTQTLKTRNYSLHFFRALYGFLTLLFTVLALKYLSLATFSVLAFTVPFFVLLLAPLLVDEKIKTYHFAAIIVGFMGTYVISQPTDGEINIGIIYALLAAFFSAMLIVQTKKMTSTESAAAITFWLSIINVVLSLSFLVFNWITPNMIDLSLLLFAGFCRAGASLLLTQSLKHAPASVISPLDYTSLVWAILFGYLIWGDIPTLELYIGSVLIIVSGLYLAHKENQEEKKTA